MSDAEVLRMKGARERKARRIAAALHEYDFTAEQAEGFDEGQREIAREIAGTRTPSDATWELVVRVMRILEK